MPLTRLRVKTETPTRMLIPGRGFYQREEDRLCVQVGAFAGRRQFFSSLESETVRLDMDRFGQLIGIEVRTPRRQWPKVSLKPPSIAEPAEVRWLDFREQIAPPRLETDASRSILLIRFEDKSDGLWYLIASHVFIRVSREQSASALLVTDIEDDQAGKSLGLFRKSVNKISDNTTLKVIPADS